MKGRNIEVDRNMNHAIEYLASALRDTGHNSKPVLIHSIRVGFYLYDEGYGEEVILAGLLHDILEDTEIKECDLIYNFGESISNIVKANSFNSLIEDRLEQFKDMFSRCKGCGENALIVKAADILDNNNYIQFADDLKSREFLLLKMKSFIDISKDLIGETSLWNKLNKRYYKLLDELNR